METGKAGMVLGFPSGVLKVTVVDETVVGVLFIVVFSEDI